MTEKPFESARDFHAWHKEQDALPITRDGKLCESELQLVGWLGRDGSFARQADHLARQPLTWFSPSADPLREWKAKMDYAQADLKKSLADFEDLKERALAAAGRRTEGRAVGGPRFAWRPTYGNDTGLDYYQGCLQIQEAIRLKRIALERLDNDPPLVVVQQREAAAKKAADEAEWAENARRNRQAHIERIEAINP